MLKPHRAAADILFEKPRALRLLSFLRLAPMQDLSELYQTVLLEHNRHPRNFGVLADATGVGHGDNPSCGDQVTVYARLDGGRIAALSFQGSGCAISQASASLMTLKLKGKSPAEARALYEKFHQLVTTGSAGGADDGDADALGDLAALAGVHQFPARIKCATLGWHAALNAIQNQPGSVSTE